MGEGSKISQKKCHVLGAIQIIRDTFFFAYFRPLPLSHVSFGDISAHYLNVPYSQSYGMITNV